MVSSKSHAKTEICSNKCLHKKIEKKKKTLKMYLKEIENKETKFFLKKIKSKVNRSKEIKINVEINK